MSTGTACDDCASAQEQYCDKFVNTYGGTYLTGGKSMGGHGKYHRAPSHFVIKIPDGLDSADAAPMLCGGITLYAPLKDHGCGPGCNIHKQCWSPIKGVAATLLL